MAMGRERTVRTTLKIWKKWYYLQVSIIHSLSCTWYIFMSATIWQDVSHDLLKTWRHFCVAAFLINGTVWYLEQITIVRNTFLATWKVDQRSIHLNG